MPSRLAHLWQTLRKEAAPFARQWRKELAIAGALFVVLIGPFILRPADSTAPYHYDRRLVIMTPHVEQIRQELGVAFARQWKQLKGETLAIDWRVGGTSDLKKLIESDYRAAFERHWTGNLGQRWSTDVANSFLATKAPKAPDAREAFLESNVSIGVDLFFGGGPHDFNDQAAKGTVVATDKATQAGLPALMKSHPEWFKDESIPLAVSGQSFRDKDNRWVGTCMSSFGIVYNRDVLRRLGVSKDPTQWNDLTDPRLMGQIALGDPNGSSSVVTAFEMLIQQQIHLAIERLTKNPGRLRTPAAIEAAGVRQGWLEGLRLIQRIAGNTRYFADTSSKIPLEVSQGDAAAGMCIDFYGRSSEEAVRKADGTSRVGFVAPLGGTSFAVDPIALMRGAPQPQLAQAFMEFVLSDQGQKIWDFRVGTPGGPQHTALRRLPIRKDFYTKENLAFMSDPAEQPYEKAKALVYHPEWTGPAFNSLRFIIRVLCVDTHDELRRTWKMLTQQGHPPRATEVFEQLAIVDYDSAMGDINKIINSSDKVQQVREARRLTDAFRRQYEQAYDFAKVQR